MKKLFLKCGNLVAVLALMVTTVSVNTCCAFFWHQPELPAAAKRLRKF